MATFAKNVLRSAMISVILATEKTSDVFFSHSELRGQRSSGRRRRRDLDEGKAQARVAFCSAAHAFRHSSVHRGIRLARIGWDSFACRGARHGRGIHALRAGASPFFAAAKCAALRTEREEPQPDAAVPRAGRCNYALYFVGADGVPIAAVRKAEQYRVHQSSHKQ